MTPSSVPSKIRFPGGRCHLALASLSLGLALVMQGCATKPPEPPALSADQVVVKKSERKMQLLKAGQVVREYRINLGDNPYGHKAAPGRRAHPGGRLRPGLPQPAEPVPQVAPHLLSQCRRQARGPGQGVDPGGLIMIHGRPNYIDSPRILAEYDNRDWTNGCIAVKNARDGRDLDGGARRDAHPHPAVGSAAQTVELPGAG